MNLDDKNIFNELNNLNVNNSNPINPNSNKIDMNNRSNNFGLGNEEIMDFELTYVDYLTSQYIDAELSFSEDTELRELIAKDEKSKNTFDSSVDIFLAIKKENAALELNSDIFSKSNLDKTEDLLMSRLFGNDMLSIETNDKNNKNESIKENHFKPLVYNNSSLYAKDTEQINLEIEKLELTTNTNNILNSNTNAITNETKSTKILQLNNILVNNFKGYFNQVNYRKITAVAACLMIFSIYNISEFKNELGITSFASINMEMKYNDSENKIANTIENNNELGKTVKNNEKTISSNSIYDNGLSSKSHTNSKNNNSDIYFVSASETTNEATSKNELNVSNLNSNSNSNNLQSTSQSNFENTTIAANSEINTNNTNEPVNNDNQINTSTNSTTTVITNTLDNNITNVKLNYNEPSYLATDKPKLNAKVTSSISNEFSNSFFAEKHNAQVSHYAQSIAFSIDENTDFGFEIGYSDLNFDDKANLRITKEIPNTTPGSNLKTYTTIIVPVELRKNYSLYWAMGFMETKVVNVYGIDLLGRVGLGLSNDGLQTSLRLNSRYEILTNLFINVGLDSRYMSVNLPLYENALNIRHTSSFAINYGIQYKF